MGHCPACGRPLRLIHVHGHGQCASCGSNVEPCCAGAGTEAELATGPTQAAESLPLPLLFADLGGGDAAVTHDALVHAVCCLLGCDLTEACERLAAEMDAGRLRRIAPGIYRRG